jgi:hypothetical protein
MKSFLKQVVVGLLTLTLTVPAAFAQERVPFRQEELDQMLAPIALYPDSLLSQILMASTYPLEVVQASRWSRANPGLTGQDAVRAVERMDWDPSVKSLTAFPQVLTMMDQKLEWTERLGEAFLAQQADVMDAVQGLRRRAEATGNLRSSEQMRVGRQGEVIYIEQPAPEIVYVPYYNPIVVYGAWWWPAYPPVYWAPFPAYYVGPGHRPAFFWGSGIVISAGFFFGHFDWHRRHATVVHNHVTVNRTTVIHQPGKRVVWDHNPAHRRGVPFRNPDARQRYEQSRAAADTRRDAGRGDIARTERRADDSRTADNRQRRLDERARPSIQPNTRLAQPETRSTQPDRNVRPERSTPQANDRHGERSENRDAPRPQPRSAEPRPAAIAPVVRPNPAPAAAAPTVRAQPRPEPRPAAPAANAHTSPRPAFEGNRRVEARNDAGRAQQHNSVRQSAPAPRPSVSSSAHLPRAVNVEHRAGGGTHRQQSMGERIR